MNKNPTRLAWALTGSGHYLRESLDVLNGLKEVDVFLSKSLDDQNRTWAWEYDHPRITIAFDILPASNILNFEGENKMGKNHWIPI